MPVDIRVQHSDRHGKTKKQNKTKGKIEPLKVKIFFFRNNLPSNKTKPRENGGEEDGKGNRIKKKKNSRVKD